DRRRRAGELLVALAGVGGAQVVKTLQAVCVQQFARRTDLPVEKLHVALIGSEQVAAASGRGIPGLAQGLAHAGRGLDPARCRCTSAATFGAVLDVDPSVLLGLAL